MSKPEVTVVIEETQEIVHVCASVREAELFVALQEVVEPDEVHAGKYGINAPEHLVNGSRLAQALTDPHYVGDMHDCAESDYCRAAVGHVDAMVNYLRTLPSTPESAVILAQAEEFLRI